MELRCVGQCSQLGVGSFPFRAGKPIFPPMWPAAAESPPTGKEVVIWRTGVSSPASWGYRCATCPPTRQTACDKQSSSSMPPFASRGPCSMNSSSCPRVGLPFFPVRLTQCLLLGLRKLRQAYQARTTTWLALCRAALPAADGDMPGEGQVDDRPPLRNSSSSLTAWLQSDAGQRLIRELRWALLRPEAAAARLRSMHPCGRLSDSTIISLLLQHGGAIISETLPSWAPDLPSWSEASSALAVPCTCVPVLPAPSACCWTCGGVRLPELPIVPLPCIWCKQSGPAACVSCNITVHPRGSCRWNSGAHRAYHSSSPALQLCPDCWCIWARLLAASPRRRRPTASQELLSHLRAAAEQCQQGAGSSAVRKPALRLKHIRRWALAFIRRHGGTSVTALQQEFCRREPSLADDAANRLVLSASGALCAEGHAYLERDTLCPALE
ncbi:unnamed protein product [Symbiodinium natans]|uniref:Uncharacterized protein n=1 Tax=Symbiodinium natans TaxID=878477 RepID=A0A812SDQ2_9DINO|nr:unnamed protein product [Symbiodinium natans]